MRQISVRSVLVLAVVLGATMPDLATSQDDGEEYCGKGELAPERLVGDTYTMSISPFRVGTGSSAAYQGQGGQVPVSITYESGAWVLRGLPKGGPQNVRLTQTGADEPDWRWSGDEKLTIDLLVAIGNSVSSEDASEWLDCDVNDYPRLTGSAETTSTDGYPVNHTFRLIVFSDNWLYGQWLWVSATDTPVERVGAISLTRPGPGQ